MKARRLLLPALTFCWFLATESVRGEELFAKTVGSVPVGDVVKSDAIHVPFMSWGGDMGLLMANDGATTQADSLYGKQGLKLKLTLGDDFVTQVRDYLSGKSPFLRGTLGQIALAAELLTADPRTEPIVFLQMTWSAGDHLVAREYIKKPTDLRGKKIALMRYGPHLSLLDDILRAAELEWKDVKIVWTEDVLGAKGPMALFKNDTNIAACLVITPEMQALTGGLKQKGTGAEGTIKGASVLISTADQKSAIADVLLYFPRLPMNHT